MRVSDSHKLVFVHVQKTGGVTVETVLDKVLPDARSQSNERHDTLAKILRREPELKHYWVVGFVRNPWARMWSWYAMIRNAAEQHAKGAQSKETRQIDRNRFWQSVASYPDFETFIQQGPEDHERLRLPQHSYLTTRTRRADFIGRTETFEADMRAVLARIGVPWDGELPHKNRGVAPSYRDHYTPEMRDRVGEIFAKDIKIFGYDF